MPRAQLKKLLPLLALGFALSHSTPAFAPAFGQEPDNESQGTEEQQEIAKLVKLMQKADKELQDKKYDEALKHYEKLFAKLEKSKVRDEVKKEIESNSRYNYACGLSLTGKKDEAVKALARSVELGFEDFDHMKEDTDLDAIRGEEGYKALVEKGTAAKKEKSKAASKTWIDETKAALGAKPLFDFDFDVKTIDGKALKLSDLKGKVVLVDFWGTWCPPCRAEIPHLVKLRAALKDKGFEVVGLARERDEENAQKLVKEFAEKNGVTYPLANIGDDDPAMKSAEVEAFPTLVFIDKDGKVRVKKVGYKEYEELEATATTLLEAAAGSAAAPKDAPKADAPKADAPKGEAPKADAPKADGEKKDSKKSF